MDTSLFFLRHSLKSPAPRDMHLSEEGRALARETGEKFLRGRNIATVVTTPHFRTAETAALMCEGAGDTRVVQHVVNETLGDYSWHGKEGEINAWDLAQAIVETPVAVERRMKAMKAAFYTHPRPLSANGDVLVVGHLLITELLVYAMTGKVIPKLKECEGVELGIANGDAYIIREFRR